VTDYQADVRRPGRWAGRRHTALLFRGPLARALMWQYERDGDQSYPSRALQRTNWDICPISLNSPGRANSSSPNHRRMKTCPTAHGEARWRARARLRASIRLGVGLLQRSYPEIRQLRRQACYAGSFTGLSLKTTTRKPGAIRSRSRRARRRCVCRPAAAASDAAGAVAIRRRDPTPGAVPPPPRTTGHIATRGRQYTTRRLIKCRPALAHIARAGSKATAFWPTPASHSANDAPSGA